MSDHLPHGGHWDSHATANPLEDFRKFGKEAEAELMGLNATALTPERLAVAAATMAALGQNITQDVPSPVQRPRKRTQRARRRKSPWINDATVGMLGRGWRP